MRCSRAQSELHLKFGTAPEELAVELKDHLVSCPECRGVHKELAGLSRQCTGLKEYSPGNHVWDAIEKEMGLINSRLVRNELQKAETISIFSPWRIAAAAAAIILITLSIVLISVNRGSTDTDDSGHPRISDKDTDNTVIYRPQYQPAAVREETVFAIPIEGNIIMFRREQESDSGYRNCTFNF